MANKRVCKGELANKRVCKGECMRSGSRSYQISSVPKEAAKRVNEPKLAPASMTNDDAALVVEDDDSRYRNMELRMGSHRPPDCNIVFDTCLKLNQDSRMI